MCGILTAAQGPRARQATHLVPEHMLAPAHLVQLDVGIQVAALQQGSSTACMSCMPCVSAQPWIEGTLQGRVDARPGCSEKECSPPPQPAISLSKRHCLLPSRSAAQQAAQQHRAAGHRAAAQQLACTSSSTVAKVLLSISKMSSSDTMLRGQGEGGMADGYKGMSRADRQRTMRGVAQTRSTGANVAALPRAAHQLPMAHSKVRHSRNEAAPHRGWLSCRWRKAETQRRSNKQQAAHRGWLSSRWMLYSRTACFT